ncbi:hypothetical protein Syun_004379 [Stephania yunnanensis]|uniref:Glycine-rich domain-containing protein 1 n=1 Tax=Stephania yunnanensis TaxID=152371 RepID=A0AAP0Q0R0_9MAGN
MVLCRMEKEQELEWVEAQKIVASFDLVGAAKRQIEFLAAVDRHRCLYDGPVLDRAIFRYKKYWLPLLAKYADSEELEAPLVVPLDCEWIWHCHRLNPIRYKADCEEFYGRILDNKNVVSTVQGASGKKSEEIWNRLYPGEPYPDPDMIKALGKVLEHDDTDSNRTKGQKLDVGFSETTKQWEETFGYRYWRAGAMYRGTPPSPVAVFPWLANDMDKSIYPPGESTDKIQVPQIDVVEVLLEIVGVRNMPEGHNSGLFVFFSKKNPDTFCKERRRLSIFSESGRKQVATFPCEFSGELLFELMSPSPSSLPISRLAKSLGSTTISLHDLLNPISKLSVDKWFELTPTSNSLNSKPISLRIAVSITVPTPAQYLLQMVKSNFLRNSCFTPGMSIQQAKSTCIVDEVGNEIVSLQMRDAKKSDSKISSASKKQVIGVVGSSGEVRVLAGLGEVGWSIVDFERSYQLRKNSGKNGHIFELRGNRMFKLFPGRKLEYEPKSCRKHKNERYFVTVVEFSADYPYGNAMALLNLKSGVLEIKETWFLVPAATLAFVLSDMVKKEGLSILLAGEENLNLTNLDEEVDGHETKDKHSNESGTVKEALLEVTEEGNVVAPEKGGNMVRSGGGCGSGCGSDCSNMVNSGGCGNMVNAGGHGGCGSGCGGSGGCGNMVNSGGCGGCGGGGCGGSGGCGNMVSSGGCGGGCGGGAGTCGCGGGCGGGCGNMVAKTEECGTGDKLPVDSVALVVLDHVFDVQLKMGFCNFCSTGKISGAMVIYVEGRRPHVDFASVGTAKCQHCWLANISWSLKFEYNSGNPLCFDGTMLLAFGLDVSALVFGRF